MKTIGYAARAAADCITSEPTYGGYWHYRRHEGHDAEVSDPGFHDRLVAELSKLTEALLS